MEKAHAQIGLIIGLIAVSLFLFGVSAITPALAHGGNTASSTSKAEIKIKKSGKNVDASCMQTAVATRESALLTAFGAFHDDIEEALTERKDALNTAWGLATGKDRSKSLASAWQAWNKDHKSALEVFKKARKSAWETFKTTAKNTCKESLPSDEGLKSDTSGSISI